MTKPRCPSAGTVSFCVSPAPTVAVPAASSIVTPFIRLTSTTSPIQAMAPAACSQGDALLASPFDGVDHALPDVAAHDCRRIARVQAVPADPRRLVAAIAGPHDFTRQLDRHQITVSVARAAERQSSPDAI